jgi:hypothetical protein
MPDYEHTQRGRWHYIMLLLGAVMLAGAWLGREEFPVPFILVAVAAVFVIVALMFMTLTVRDGGDRLLLRFGPVALLRASFRYEDITAAAPDRSKLIDGWGIHWIPGRGTTYNLWGYDCVRLVVRGKTVRVGTNDVENLAAFLRKKVGERQGEKRER